MPSYAHHLRHLNNKKKIDKANLKTNAKGFDLNTDLM